MNRSREKVEGNERGYRIRGSGRDRKVKDQKGWRKAAISFISNMHTYISLSLYIYIV